MEELSIQQVRVLSVDNWLIGFTEGPMVQRVGKNERHEDNVGKESGPVEIKTELKKKKSAPTAKGRGTHPPHRIKIEELEKAYNTNFLNKLNRKENFSEGLIDVFK